MAHAQEATDTHGNDIVRQGHTPTANRRHAGRRRAVIIASMWLAAVVILASAATAWLGSRATIIKNELEATALLIPVLKENIAGSKPQQASLTADQLRAHTGAARETAGDPLWTLAASAPLVGANFSAIAELARAADDVAILGVAPLVKVFDSLDWDGLLPSGTGSNLEPLQNAAPSVSAAAHAVRVSAERLERIDAKELWPQVADPLLRARAQLRTVTGALDASANAAEIAPGIAIE